MRAPVEASGHRTSRVGDPVPVQGGWQSNSDSIRRQGSWMDLPGVPETALVAGMSPDQPGAYFGFSDRASQPGRMPAVSARRRGRLAGRMAGIAGCRAAALAGSK